MKKKIIFSKKAPKTIGPYSQAIRVNDFLFLSGQIGLNPKTKKLENKSLFTEIEQIMKNIQAILKKGNMSFENIVKTSVFLKDLNYFSRHSRYTRAIIYSAKVKDCKEVGFKSSLIKLPYDIKEEKLLNEISKLNNNKDIDGFIVQLPLPDHIDEDKVLLSISPNKDVDGFNPFNLGHLLAAAPKFIPCTPYGCIEILKYYNIELIFIRVN